MYKTHREYIAKLAKHRLLTAAEEIRLAKTMRGPATLQRKRQAAHARFREALCSVPFDAKLTDRRGRIVQVIDWIKPAVEQAAKDARQELISCNYKRVISIAGKYQGNHDLEFDDLFNEGVIGLMTAVDKFDPDLGWRFSTYATWWIRQAVSRSIPEQGSTIRISVHMVDRITKVRKVATRLEMELYRRPTVDEIAAACHIRPDQVAEAFEFSSRQALVSLDAPVSEKEPTDATTGDLVPLDAPLPDDILEIADRREQVYEALDRLDVREGQILEIYYGLRDGNAHTLDETAQKYGLTRERIRQIRNEAIEKMSRNGSARKLKDFDR